MRVWNGSKNTRVGPATVLAIWIGTGTVRVQSNTSREYRQDGYLETDPLRPLMWTQVEPPSKFKMAASLPCLMYKYA